MMELPDWVRGVRDLIINTCIVLVPMLLVLFWWFYPKDRAAEFKNDPKARADVEDNFRKTISQVYAGAAVLAGAWLTQETLRPNSEQATDLLISNEVSKSFELLGSDRREIRLGGIYGLEAVMKKSKEYRAPILETLSAFVRDHAKGGSLDNDALAALGVIIARRQFPGVVDLRGARLEGIFVPGGNLSGAWLDYTCLAADLRGIDLRGALLRHADFNGSNRVPRSATAPRRGSRFQVRKSDRNTEPRGY
jgi:uncharacterized protein YjbI with pentapeptide repeats